MKRSDFIRLLLTGSAVAVAKGAEAAGRKRLRYLYSGPVNGTYYYEASKVYDRIAHNDLLELRLETDNAHDHRAIEVFWNGHKLGYLPRADNKVIYNLMKDGAVVEARIKKEDRKVLAECEDLYNLIRMRVWMVEPY